MKIVVEYACDISEAWERTYREMGSELIHQLYKAGIPAYTTKLGARQQIVSIEVEVVPPETPGEQDPF